jgi:hypothetical protein
MTPTFEPYHYFRHHPTGWGVRDARDQSTLAVGLDKNVAAALACALNGDIRSARDLLDHMPDQMPIAMPLSVWQPLR